MCVALRPFTPGETLLNLGMQSISLMRCEMDDSFEATVAKCNSISDVRKAAEKDPSVREKTSDSISQVKILMSNIFARLKLKGNAVECFTAAAESEMEEVWENVLSIDDTASMDQKWVKAVLKKHPKLVEFMDHCCHRRHYMFCIKKCGEQECQICKPPRLPHDVFDEIKNLPDPVATKW